MSADEDIVHDIGEKDVHLLFVLVGDREIGMGWEMPRPG